MPAAEIASVALDADPLTRLAGEHRANLDPLDAGVFDLLDLVLVDHLVGMHQHFVGERVADVFERDAPQHAVAEAFDYLAAFDQRRHLDAVERAAIVLDDDRVLRHIDQAAGQVAGVRRLERGVGQALARAVSRDEVLQNRQTLAEVRRDRSLDDFTRRLRHQATESRQLANLLLGTAGARVGHDENRVERRPGDGLALVVLAEDLGRQSFDNGAADLILNFGPDIDDLVVALAVGDDAVVVLLLNLADLLLRAVEQMRLLRRNGHVLDRDRDSRLGGEFEADVLQAVGENDRGLVAGAPIDDVDQVAELLLLHRLVELGEGYLGRNDLVEQHAADRGGDALVTRQRSGGGRSGCGALLLGAQLAVGLRLRRDDSGRELRRHADGDLRVQIDLFVIVRDSHFLDVGEVLALAACERLLTRHVVKAQHHVLGRHDYRLAGSGRQDVVGRHHERARLDLRFDRQRHVHRHLVTVEVGVVRDAYERMQLNRLAFDQHRLERLDSQAMQRRRAVEQHRMLADNLVEDIPNVLALFLDHLLRALDSRDVALFFELVVDERLEQLERHLLRQTALMEPKLGAHDDNRAARVVDALAEQVLAEASRLALEHVGQRLERTLGRSGNRAAAAAVVEQRVDRFLQHPLFVADNDVGSVELDQPLQAVVTVDYAPIQIVEIGSGETAAVERNQRTKIRRNDRQDGEDHPLRLVARIAKRVDDLQALRNFLAARLARGSFHLGAQLFGQLVERELSQQRADRLGAHLGLEGVAVLLARLAIFALGQQLFVLQRSLTRVGDDVALEVQDLFEFLQRHVEQRADTRRQRAQEPDVRDRSGEIDMTHPLAPDFRLDYFDATLLADDAAMTHALVLAAVAFVVLGRPENLGAEQPVTLRLEGPVVDRFGLLDLAVRPRADHFRRRDRNPDRVERQWILGLLENAEEIFHLCYNSLALKPFAAARAAPCSGRAIGAP